MVKKIDLARYVARVLHDSPILLKDDHHEVKRLMKKGSDDLWDLAILARKADRMSEHLPTVIKMALDDLEKNNPGEEIKLSTGVHTAALMMLGELYNVTGFQETFYNAITEIKGY